VKTSISKIETRLVDGNTGESIIGSGDAIRYSNGLYGVSYEAVPGIKNAKVGDSINLCLLSIPENCPPGDNRGKVYGATNLRTGEKWGLPDSQHFCGGA